MFFWSVVDCVGCVQKQARLAAETAAPIESESEKQDFEIKEKAPNDTSSALPDLEKSDSSERQQGNIVEGLPATTCLARIGRPIFRVIDRPWKVSFLLLDRPYTQELI